MVAKSADSDSAVPIRVLLVEDEDRCRELYKDMLATEPSFQTQVCDDAESAQAYLKSVNFDVDVCLLDLILPGMQGDELLAWVKQVKPTMPVVILSGNRTDEQLMRCLKTGAIDFLEKPIQVKKLIRALKTAVSRQGQIQESLGDIQAVSPSSDWVELTAPSEMEYLARIQRFTEVVLENRLPDEVTDDLRLALEEFGRNAIEWGNKFDRNKQFRISYCIFSDRIVFKIEDEGEGFKPSNVPDPSKDPKAHILNRKAQGKRPGGFGVYLVQKLMDEVVYSERGNVVLMTKFF